MLYGMHQHSQPTFDNIPFCSATGRGYSINSSPLFLQERKRRMESPYYITTGRVRFSLRPESGELGHTPPPIQNFQLSSTFLADESTFQPLSLRLPWGRRIALEWRKVVSVALLAYAAMPCFAQAFALVFFHQVNLGSISKLLQWVPLRWSSDIWSFRVHGQFLPGPERNGISYNKISRIYGHLRPRFRI